MDASIQKKYADVSRCIYCGSLRYSEDPKKRLGDEHVVPEGLGGRLILPLASCLDCERAINRWEQFLQKDMLAAFRYQYDLPTKRPKERPKTLPVEILDGDIYVRDEIPIGEYPLHIMLPLYGSPEILRPRILKKSPLTSARNFPNRMEFDDELWFTRRGLRSRIQRGQIRTASGQTDFDAFAGMLAKIGHSFATGELGFQGFTPLIFDGKHKGTAHPLHHFVGCDREIAPPGEERHELDLRLENVHGRRFWVVRIRLFSDLGWPTYQVVVGLETGHPQRLVRKMASPDDERLAHSFKLDAMNSALNPGDSSTEWLCSSCDAVIVQGRDLRPDIAVQCAQCRKWSVTVIDDTPWVLAYAETPEIYDTHFPDNGINWPK